MQLQGGTSATSSASIASASAAASPRTAVWRLDAAALAMLRAPGAAVTQVTSQQNRAIDFALAAEAAWLDPSLVLTDRRLRR